MSSTQQIIRAEGYERDSFASLLRLNPQGAVPPPSAYITPDNQLGLYTMSAVAGVVLTIVARILLPDGKISLNQFNYSVPGGYLTANSLWPLPEGFILTLVVYSSAASYARNTFVQVQLVQTTQTPQIFTSVLCCGYPSRYAPLSFPVGVNQNPLDGPGNLRSITGTQPAVGGFIQESALSNVRWRLISLFFTFQTSAAVIGRTVFLQFFQSGVNAFNFLLNLTPQPASTLWGYCLFSGATQSVPANIPAVIAPLPNQLILNSGDFFRVVFTNGDSADQFNAPVYSIEEWLCP